MGPSPPAAQAPFRDHKIFRFGSPCSSPALDGVTAQYMRSLCVVNGEQCMSICLSMIGLSITPPSCYGLFEESCGSANSSEGYMSRSSCTTVIVDNQSACAPPSLVHGTVRPQCASFIPSTLPRCCSRLALIAIADRSSHEQDSVMFARKPYNDCLSPFARLWLTLRLTPGCYRLSFLCRQCRHIPRPLVSSGWKLNS